MATEILHDLLLLEEDVGPIPSGVVSDEEIRAAHEEQWNRERENLLLLLEARVLLHQLVLFKKEKDEAEKRGADLQQLKARKFVGNLSLMEIADILKREPGGDDTDLHSELARLKRLVIQEIKKNHVLEGSVARLDLKISLLITNKGATHDFAAKKKEAFLARLAARSEENRRKKMQPAEEPKSTLGGKQLEAYGDLFYVLQTEPRYLAKCLYLLQPQHVEAFLDSTVITLFGEAFSPREEYLILNLFLAAMEQEISVVKNVQDFISADSVLPKLLITYNRRTQGTMYLRNTLPPLLKTMQDRDLDFELNPVLVHQQIAPGANVTEEQAMDNPEVKKQIEKRVKDLEKVCQAFLGAILGSMDKLPYGLRWICKMMRTLCEKQLPDASKEDLLRLIGYFVYYRFINVALVSPEAFKIVTRDLGTLERKNLIGVGKVLQKAFNLKTFGKQEKALMPLNGLLERSRADLVKYFTNLVQVADPEDFLQVDHYNEMTQKEKPVIIISLKEMISIHRLVFEKLDSLAGADDPLRSIMKDLGQPASLNESAESRPIQLTLQNRFKKEVKEDEQNLVIYAETKELCIPILRQTPFPSNTLVERTLPDVLDVAAEYAKKNKNQQLAEQVAQAQKNLQLLEKAGLVNPRDDYAQFIHDLAIEVANRAAIRERQKKEIQRLTVTLNKLKKNSQFSTEQAAEYEKVLEDALKKQYEGKKEKDLQKPKKYEFKDLEQRGVIYDTEMSVEQRKKVKFAFSAPEPGVFECAIKFDKNHVEKHQIKLDDLLEKNFNNVEKIDRPQVSFSVDNLLLLLNKHILC